VWIRQRGPTGLALSFPLSNSPVTKVKLPFDPNAHPACRIPRWLCHRVWCRHQGNVFQIQCFCTLGFHLYVCCTLGFPLYANCITKAGKWGSKSYPAAYKAGYAAGILREQKKELHAQQMMQVRDHCIMSFYLECRPWMIYVNQLCLISASQVNLHFTGGICFSPWPSRGRLKLSPAAAATLPRSSSPRELGENPSMPMFSTSISSHALGFASYFALLTPTLRFWMLQNHLMNTIHRRTIF
jgi:hypothetical protein